MTEAVIDVVDVMLSASSISLMVMASVTFSFCLA